MNLYTWSHELDEVVHLKQSFEIENAKLVKELDTLGRAQNDEVVLLYCRRVLEVIISEICLEKLCRDRGTEPLLSIIDRLVKDKVIPEFIHSAMHNLNRNALYGAHPKDFDPRQVRTTLIELLTILDWYFKDKGYRKVRYNYEKIVNQEIAENIAPPLQKKEDKHSLSVLKKKDIFILFIISSIVITVVLIVVIFFKKENVKPNSKIVESNFLKGVKEPKPAYSLLKTVEPSGGTEKTAIENQKNKNSNFSGLQKKDTSQVPNLRKKADIVLLINELSDSEKPFSERKKILQQLMPEFEKHAIIAITIDGKIVDKIFAEEYFNRLLTLKNAGVEIISQKKGVNDKIEALNILEKNH